MNAIEKVWNQSKILNQDAVFIKVNDIELMKKNGFIAIKCTAKDLK